MTRQTGMSASFAPPNVWAHANSGDIKSAMPHSAAALTGESLDILGLRDLDNADAEMIIDSDDLAAGNQGVV